MLHLHTHDSSDVGVVPFTVRGSESTKVHPQSFVSFFVFVWFVTRHNDTDVATVCLIQSCRWM